MNVMDRVKQKIQELDLQADEILSQGIHVLEEFPVRTSVILQRPIWETPSRSTLLLQFSLMKKYQIWYSSAYELIKEYLPDRTAEFTYCYENNQYRGVMDSLTLKPECPWISTYPPDNSYYFLTSFNLQRTILNGLPSTLEMRELNLRKMITADVARDEIDQAEILFANKFERAAGSLAGVALELHLKTLCNFNGISYASKATIQPLIQELRKANVLDVAEAKHIEYLASIRNKCAHGSSVTEKEIQSLIEETKKLI